MYLEFYNPPGAIYASGTKVGVELGGNKTIVSIDDKHNLYSEGNIFTEMSWAEFYQDEGLEDQIDTFTTKQFDSIREDPEALVATIAKCLRKIIKEKKLFYGIMDLEVDAFMNQSTVIPGLKLDPTLINKLLEAHKKNRDEDLFPKLIQDESGVNSIKISFQGTNKRNIYFYEDETIEDLADKLRLAKGFATGIVCASNKAAYFFLMNDKVVFKEDEVPEFYIDQDCILVIESGIERSVLFPISWFRIDIGIRSLETLELWEEIKGDPELQKVLEEYDNYINLLIVEKYKSLVAPQDAKMGRDLYDLTEKERKQALKEMEKAIKILTKIYKE